MKNGLIPLLIVCSIKEAGKLNESSCNLLAFIVVFKSRWDFFLFFIHMSEKENIIYIYFILISIDESSGYLRLINTVCGDLLEIMVSVRTTTLFSKRMFSDSVAV